MGEDFIAYQLGPTTEVCTLVGDNSSQAAATKRVDELEVEIDTLDAVEGNARIDTAVPWFHHDEIHALEAFAEKGRNIDGPLDATISCLGCQAARRRK